MDALGPALSLEIAPAREADLLVVSEILTEAAHWLIDRGEPLWQPEDLVPARLRSQLQEGSLHVARHAGETVATIAFQWQDRLFWPDVLEGESAFIHRLAVRREVAGTGVAAALIAWAEERAREAGCKWLRLDCSARHEGLGRYYEAAGFERHSAGEIIVGYPFVRYQKRLR